MSLSSVVTCSATMFVGTPLVCGVLVVRHCLPLCPLGVLSGHPRPPVVTAPVHRGSPCRYPLEGDESPERQPLWLCRVSGRDREMELSCGRRWITLPSSTPPRLVKCAQVALETFLDELVFACPLARECDSSAAPLRVHVLVCVRERELIQIRGVFAIIQVRCGLTHHVLELHRLNAVCVSLQVFFST